MNGEIELEMSLVSYLLGSISDPLRFVIKPNFCTPWLAWKTRASYSTNQKLINQNQSRLVCMRFPALGADNVYWLRAFIGSLCRLSFL